MMVNKHTSLGTQDNKDFDPIDSYGAISDAEPNKGHTHPYPTNIKPFEDAASESKFRNSWEENDSDDEPYLADAYTYGRDDDDESEDELEERPHHANAIVEPQPSTPNHQHKMTFDQASDDENEVQKPSNSNVIRVSATNARASILSARSYSSHTKHHSFGYDQDRPEPSESESESNSESESDREESYMPALSSPASSQVPSGSRPASSTFSATKTLSKPGSPVLSRSTLPVEPEIKKHSEIDQSDKQDERPVSSPPSWSALDKSTPPPPEPSSTATVPSTPQHLQSASAISSSQTIERTSSSGSNTSRSSSGIGSPPITGYFQSNQTTLARSISSASSGRLSNGLHNQRPLSYSSLSDTSLNDISLDEPFTPNALKRNSGTIAPRVPVASSNAGFPSSFFGGKPHPKSQQYHQQQQPQPSPVSPQPVAAAASTSPEPRTGGVLNGSISSIASSISGAFMGRGFGSGNNSSATLPPSAMAKTPSRTSARGSGAGMMVNTSPTGIDLRPSNNVSPERASLYSTMTTDSNMDLLLSRLDAQNSMLEVDTKRRVTNDSEMDRAIGHAKEESVGEDVDWGKQDTTAWKLPSHLAEFIIAY
ncbi:hypothetical protein BC939DRAFT_458643 [Gamsiella multidivaricata]|uniref:uncharacterized protein n=1 Tax=Gamsiella multidivaricata TaxID=101098 RepID=UPI00221F856E|nr:uncharacterized protein BC939DRAFT_458643 [Gamsiella multidivaricata]KAI7819993.1 hypothetical protein BC939DRAFT_458643 [Gamsiella multidivaricata]